jgi:signal transduction histidine kinase
MTYFNEYVWLIVVPVIVVFILVFYTFFRNLKKQTDPRKEFVPRPASERTEDAVPWSKVSEIVEQERQRIASELHDELGTLLSVIHLDLELVLREASSLTPHGEARLIEIRKNLNHVIESIRTNIWSLSPQMFDRVDLGFALQELCHKLDAYKGTHLNFVQLGTEQTLNQKQKLNLFRIVQELLTNAIKHSGAWNISVHLEWTPAKLTIVVEDDGSGYQRAEYEHKNTGMGTINIIKRAEEIGAQIKREELARGLRATIELELGTRH